MGNTEILGGAAVTLSEARLRSPSDRKIQLGVWGESPGQSPGGGRGGSPQKFFL